MLMGPPEKALGKESQSVYGSKTLIEILTYSVGICPG
jgi:hypothetical protein